MQGLIFPLFLALSTVLSYKIKRGTTLNGRVYEETLDQPWFQHIHDPHRPIPLAIVNTTDYGKHVLPKDDVYIEHEWTDEEKQYLPCLNLTCVCPFYKGKVIGSKCILPNGKPLVRAIRKEIRTLTEHERHQIERAFLKLKATGIYDRIGLVHKYSGLHEGPGFFTWHREFLKRSELLLRRFLPMGSELGLPYWDSALDSMIPDSAESIFFSKYFIGTTDDEGYVDSGPYKDFEIMEGGRKVQRFVGQLDNGEPFNNPRIDYVLNKTLITEVLAPVVFLETCPIMILDQRLFEYSHDYVHDFINGDMKESYSSSSEIAFYFHHTMVDHIWELWRQKNQDREQREKDYPPDFPDCYPEKHFADSKLKELDPFSNKDVLSNDYTDFMYSYAPRPSCVSKHEECGSKYLFCYTKDTFPYCMSKVRLGGKCEGFENYPICHNGHCRNGKCEPWEILPDPFIMEM